MTSLPKGQWRGALMFSSICAWINNWWSNGDAGDLRHNRAHYDATVMPWLLRTDFVGTNHWYWDRWWKPQTVPNHSMVSLTCLQLFKSQNGMPHKIKTIMIIKNASKLLWDFLWLYTPKIKWFVFVVLLLIHQYQPSTIALSQWHLVNQRQSNEKKLSTLDK